MCVLYFTENFKVPSKAFFLKNQLSSKLLGVRKIYLCICNDKFLFRQCETEKYFHCIFRNGFPDQITRSKAECIAMLLGPLAVLFS